MDFLNFDLINPSSPILWIIVGVGVLAFYLRRGKFGFPVENRQDDETQVFVFDPDSGYKEAVGRSISSNVSYGNGAFLKRDSCAIKFYYGRPKRRPESLTSRRVMTTYITRHGDSSPLDPGNQDWKPLVIEKDDFESFKSIAVEHEYSRGRMDSAKADIDKVLILSVTVASVALGIIGWLIVLTLPLTPLVEKSN